MPRYEKAFKKILKEQPEFEDQAPISDEDAYMNGFDEPENAEAFETEPDAPGFQSAYIEKAKGWISKLDDFAEWINGTEADSLNKQFIALDKEGSPFEGISSHSKKLTSIAESLAALGETIKGHILNADKTSEGETVDGPILPQE